MWQEIVTPFYEWQQYLSDEKKRIPNAIQGKMNQEYVEEFWFVKEMSRLLTHLLDEELSLNQVNKMIPSEYADSMVAALIDLHLVEKREKRLVALPEAVDWLQHSFQEKSCMVYRQVMNRLRKKYAVLNYTERDIREVERCLKRVTHQGWIYLEEFLEGATPQLDSTDPIALVKKGKRWRYSFPDYTANDYRFMQAVLVEGLFAAGLIALGTHQGKQCFRVTPFGRLSF